MKRNKPLRRTGFKQKPRKPLKRAGFKSRIGRFGAKPRQFRVPGQETTSDLKEQIQAILRRIVMIRDGSCILNGIRCNAVVGMSGIVFQADHLITRANSATYADSRLVVLVCKSCHGWKSVGSNRNKAEYDELVKSILPPERVALWERCEEESRRPHRKYTSDWKLAKLALEQELKKYENP